MSNKIKSRLITISICFIVLVIIQALVTPVFFPQYSSSVTQVYGTLQDDLEEIEKELEKLKQEKKNIQDTINSEALKRSQYGFEIASLAKEVELMLNELQEKNLTIEKLNLEIDILDYQIEETQEDIDIKEKDIQVLEKETQQRLSEMYIDTKSYSNISLLFNSQGSDLFVKNDLYRKAIQDNTNNGLRVLQADRKELESKKGSLDEDKVKIEKDKTLIDEERLALEKQQTLLDQRQRILNAKIQQSLSLQKQQELRYEQSSDEEQQLLAEQELIKQKILEEISQIPSGSRVLKGTIIGFEGMTGWATGPHLHFAIAQNGVTQNPCNFLNCPARSAGSILWPINPAGVITSGYGPRFDGFHPAIDISTGGTGQIIAAHDGWIAYYTWPCYDLPWVNCNGGAAKYAIICEDKTNCNNGLKSAYWHLK